MTQYLLSIVQPDGPVPEPAVLDRIMAEVEAVDAQMRAAGVWVLSCGLELPAAAIVLRVVDGDVRSTDGPAVPGDAHLGGFTIVAVDDRDAALEWGARLARATTLPVEVRAIA